MLTYPAELELDWHAYGTLCMHAANALVILWRCTARLILALVHAVSGTLYIINFLTLFKLSFCNQTWFSPKLFYKVSGILWLRWSVCQSVAISSNLAGENSIKQIGCAGAHVFWCLTPHPEERGLGQKCPHVWAKFNPIAWVGCLKTQVECAKAYLFRDLPPW